MHRAARTREKPRNGQEATMRSPDAREHLPTDGSADAEISIKGLDTSHLVTTFEKWGTQGAPKNSGSGCSDDADESKSDGSTIESGLMTIHL